MIIDRLEELTRYTPMLPQLKEAIRIIESGVLSTQELGRYECEDPSLYYTIMEGETTLIEAESYEVHRRAHDLQILLTGSERMAVASSTTFEPTTEWDSERDAIFGRAQEIVSYYADPSLFTIFFAGEPHAPSLVGAQPQRVKKVVFKLLF
jgi:biofilm protein TabA